MRNIAIKGLNALKLGQTLKSFITSNLPQGLFADSLG